MINKPTMTSPRIKAIRERVEKATEGPWDYENMGWRVDVQIPDAFVYGPLVSDDDAACMVSEDASFIAHARSDIPYLLAAFDAVSALVPHDVGCAQTTEGHIAAVRRMFGTTPKCTCNRAARIEAAIEGREV